MDTNELMKLLKEQPPFVPDDIEIDERLLMALLDRAIPLIKVAYAAGLLAAEESVRV